MSYRHAPSTQHTASPDERARVRARLGKVEEDTDSGVYGFSTSGAAYLTEGASGVLGVDTTANEHDVRVVLTGRSALIYAKG